MVWIKTGSWVHWRLVFQPSLCLSSVQLKPLIIYLMMKYLTVAVLISLSGIGLADIAQVSSILKRIIIKVQSIG